MKKILGINHILVFFTIINAVNIKPLHSSATIKNCSGKIPKNIPCLIKASSYKVEIQKVDLCPKNPFPDFRTTPDYAGSFCVNLYDQNINSEKVNLTNNFELKIPENIINRREYKYISIIFKNKFTVSGKYNGSENIWNTGKKGPKSVYKAKNNFDIPEKFSEKLTNWRGSKNLKNQYCDNNGGTFSRCDLKYNGYKLTAIGLNKNFVESYGEKTKLLFYNVELSPPIILNKDTKGSINITYQKSLEVYGDGKNVKSISVAPLLLRASFRKSE